MKKFSVIALITMLIVSCSPALPQPTATIIPTETIMPTATITPFSEMKLDDFLIQSGDLPAGYSGAQIRQKLSDIAKVATKADYSINQQIAKGNDAVGSVDVLLYEDIESAKAAYIAIKKNMIKRNITDPKIGNESLASSTTLILEVVDVIFRQCNAVAHVQIMNTSKRDDVIAYMQRLSDRLKEISCR
jgi:hypothetical protein